jgi:KDO2-lipid IV(A) lauroyltransferase
MYKELQDKKQNALLLSLREQQEVFSSPLRYCAPFVLTMCLALCLKLLNQTKPDSLKPLLVKLARKNKAKVLMAWAARLDNGKGYELNVKPVNILPRCLFHQDTGLVK